MPHDEEEVQRRTAVASELLRLLANPTRLRILHELIDGECSVGTLAERAGASVPATSQHLARMRLSNVVAARRDGTTMYYSLLDNHVAELTAFAMGYADHVMRNVHAPWPNPPPPWMREWRGQ